MNERTTDGTISEETRIRDEDTRGGEMPVKDGGGKMTTADLAYGRDEATSKAPSTMEHDSEERVSLIDESDAGSYRDRWTSIQTHFIDEPRETVSDADTLVAEVIQSLATRFAQEREGLEHQWQAGSEVSTEDLRQAMQHYRSFFERLLAA
jgi:hypothetical protein